MSKEFMARQIRNDHESLRLIILLQPQAVWILDLEAGAKLLLPF